jgi:hypothetical protein
MPTRETMRNIKKYCKVCEKRTEFYYLGVQESPLANVEYYLYNCFECEGTIAFQRRPLEISKLEAEE